MSESRQPPLTLAMELDRFKKASKRLLETYVEVEAKEIYGTSKHVLMAKFLVLALTALAICLSAYGLIYELAHAAAINFFSNGSDLTQKLFAHGMILVIFGGVALTAQQRASK